MFSENELERLKREAADLGRYSVHILSKKHLTNQLWAGVAAFAVPMPIALCFRNRIVRLGVFTYVTALIVALVAAVLFGI